LVEAKDFSNMPYLMTNLLIYVVSILLITLFFGPVFNRAIQKKEDGLDFDSNAAYAFQKKNIFKWIMVNVWGFLYMVWTILPYIVASVLMTAAVYMLRVSSLTALIISSLVGLTFIVGIIVNIHKFILYKNIFFSKDGVSARDAVRESIKIGKNKNGEVWMLILAMIILTIAMMIIYFALGFLTGLIAKFIPDYLSYVEMISATAISVLFFLPLMSIVLSKGYVKIRG
jgi:hypothetical protein